MKPGNEFSEEAILAGELSSFQFLDKLCWTFAETFLKFAQNHGHRKQTVVDPWQDFSGFVFKIKPAWTLVTVMRIAFVHRIVSEFERMSVNLVLVRISYCSVYGGKSWSMRGEGDIIEGLTGTYQIWGCDSW